MNDSSTTGTTSGPAQPDLRTVVNFLCGNGMLFGRWFFDGPPAGEKDRYWWRAHLRAAFAASTVTASAEEVESLERRLGQIAALAQSPATAATGAAISEDAREELLAMAARIADARGRAINIDPSVSAILRAVLTTAAPPAPKPQKGGAALHLPACSFCAGQDISLYIQRTGGHGECFEAGVAACRCGGRYVADGGYAGTHTEERLLQMAADGWRRRASTAVPQPQPPGGP